MLSEEDSESDKILTISSLLTCPFDAYFFVSVDCKSEINDSLGKLCGTLNMLELAKVEIIWDLLNVSLLELASNMLVEGDLVIDKRLFQQSLLELAANMLVEGCLVRKTRADWRILLWLL